MKTDRLAQTLFLCATEEPPEALTLWRELTQTVSFEDLTDPQRRLLPAVWKNLSSECDNFPGCHQLRNLYRYTWAKNLRQQKCCEGAIELLKSAGVPTIVLKGIVLNLTLYEDLGMRPAHDFDILVPSHQARIALDALVQDGWKALDSEDQVAPELRLSQAVPLTKNGLEFDLHWFALREARLPQWDQELWEEAQPFQIGSVESQILSTDHQFMHLLVNGTREPENCYRFLLDLKLFLAKYEQQLQLDSVKGLLAQRNLLHRFSYLPLDEIGYAHLATDLKASWLDRCWSWCSRYVNDGSGEMVFGVYPFVDYWLHYARQGDSPLNWSAYCQQQLRIEGWRDLFLRLWAKLHRAIRQFVKGGVQ